MMGTPKMFLKCLSEPFRLPYKTFSSESSNLRINRSQIIAGFRRKCFLHGKTWRGQIFRFYWHMAHLNSGIVGQTQIQTQSGISNPCAFSVVRLKFGKGQLNKFGCRLRCCQFLEAANKKRQRSHPRCGL